MAEQYKQLWGNINSYSLVTFGVLLAKEKGIFNSLLEADKPLTSDEIAQQNKIKERYTREILGCLSASGLIRASLSETGSCVYHLEAHAKETLKEGTHLEFLGLVRSLMTRYQGVKECICVGNPGVLRYDSTVFDALEAMRKKSSKGTINFFLENIPNIREQLEKGIDVIEFGSGSAFLLAMLATMFPASTFTATEVLPNLMEDLQSKHGHIPNMKFELWDVCAIPETISKKYDWLLSIDVIHDLPHPLKALEGLRRVVKEDGVFTFVEMAGTGSHVADSGDLQAALYYAGGTFLCLPESFQNEDSEAHGPCWAKQTAIDFAKKASFEASVIPMEGKTVMYIARPV